MVPLSRCSSMNFWSSSSSVADSLMVQLISIGGAPGFNSILWSHGRFGGIFLDSSLLKTLAKSWYGLGILSSITPLLMDTLLSDLVVNTA
jgi:hypothetical protein